MNEPLGIFVVLTAKPEPFIKASSDLISRQYITARPAMMDQVRRLRLRLHVKSVKVLEPVSGRQVIRADMRSFALNPRHRPVVDALSRPLAGNDLPPRCFYR